LVWTKGSSNPIFSIDDSCASTTCSYRNERDYTPTVVNDGSGCLRMYYSAQQSLPEDVGPKDIGLATQCAAAVGGYLQPINAAEVLSIVVVQGVLGYWWILAIAAIVTVVAVVLRLHRF